MSIDNGQMKSRAVIQGDLLDDLLARAVGDQTMQLHGLGVGGGLGVLEADENLHTVEMTEQGGEHQRKAYAHVHL